MAMPFFSFKMCLVIVQLYYICTLCTTSDAWTVTRNKNKVSQDSLQTTIQYSEKMYAMSHSRNKRSAPSASVAQSGHGTTGTEPTSEHTKKTAGHQRYQVAAVDFHHVSAPYIISLWIIIAGLAKIGFHVTPKLHLIIPESCILLLIGVIIGLCLFFAGVTTFGSLTPDVFFLYLLPPIVLDAGYFMPNRLFFDNLITILLYAVIGTVWNALTIGLSLWAIGLTGIYHRSLPLLDTLLFTSIVSAVDPVAVLAVFEEVHVNEVLYIVVFGESLLNDAVTVVLYHMFEGYTEMGLPNILPIDYVAGVASFFVVALGGTFVGIVWGIFAAFISRFTHHVLAIEPLFIFVMAYLSYLTAELFHLSGIMALTFCGITMKNYVEENVSHKSHVTVKYTMKMLASSSETIIFVLLGVSTVSDKHEWSTWFVILTIVFCSIYRALGVILLTAFANRFRLHRFNNVEQFIMSYGGLRGAVAFALVLIIDDKVVPSKHMMVTAIISVVYFTVFVQGMTIGFFVNLLKVAKSTSGEISMNERLHITVIDHLMAGIEGVSDHLLGNFKIRDKFKYYNNKFIRPLLTKNPKVQEPKILQTHSKLNLTDAVNLVKNNGNLVPALSPEMGMSLSSLLKSYTQSNLFRLAPEETHQIGEPIGGSLQNIDMGELSYNPCFKDMADAEIHHILEDSMFKPPKRPRRYSRSEIYESFPKHPPFQHNMRMQIRRLVSETSKVKTKKKSSKKYPTHGKKNAGQNKTYSNTGSQEQSSKVTAAANEANMPNNMSECYENNDQDDIGITFSAGRKLRFLEDDNEESGIRTVTEAILPWKRDDGPNGSEKSARPQQEFPAWVDNKDYYLGYRSPTSTFGDEIKSSSAYKRKPSAFEFRVNVIPESNEEQELGENVPPAQMNKVTDTMSNVRETQSAKLYSESASARKILKNVNPNKVAPEGIGGAGSTDTTSVQRPVTLDIENESGDMFTNL